MINTERSILRKRGTCTAKKTRIFNKFDGFKWLIVSLGHTLRFAGFF